MPLRGFVEYKVSAEKKPDYYRVIAQLRSKSLSAGLASYTICESVDQENLFVETFLVESLEEYRLAEAKLAEDLAMQELLQALDGLIVGGLAKKKSWFFNELQFSGGA